MEFLSNLPILGLRLLLLTRSFFLLFLRKTEKREKISIAMMINPMNQLNLSIESILEREGENHSGFKSVIQDYLKKRTIIFILFFPPPGPVTRGVHLEPI